MRGLYLSLPAQQVQSKKRAFSNFLNPFSRIKRTLLATNKWITTTPDGKNFDRHISSFFVQNKRKLQQGGGDSIVFQLRLLTHSACQFDVTQQRVSALSRFCRLAWDAIEERTTEVKKDISLLFANLIYIYIYIYIYQQRSNTY